MLQPLESGDPTLSLEAWLAEAGFAPREVEPLTGDVSPRRYSRVRREDGATAILAAYPDEIADICPRFLRTTEILEGIGVRVPRVFAADCGLGWMLLEDLGPRTLGDWKGRPWTVLTPYFEQALRWIERISRIPADRIAGLNPLLGRELLRKELTQTWDLFLAPRGLTGDGALTDALRAALDEVCVRLAAEPPAPCHRDFMSRNLMPLDEQGGVAVLDHQDMRLGPPLYDLASLLNDTLFPPPEVEEALLAAALSGGEGLSGEDNRVRYHRAAAQRTLKAIGTYTSFALRGADRHLPLIGPTLDRALLHLSRIPEGAPLAGELGRVWSAVLEPAER